MARRLILTALVASMLVGCGSGTPMAGLTTSAERQHLENVPAPLVQMIPGLNGPAPTVAVLPTVAVAAPVAQAGQANAADLVVTDQELEATDLLAEQSAPFQVQGFFGDIRDAIKRVIARWKLTKEVKAALKHKNDEAFELHEGEIDDQKKNRTAPVTTVNTLADGSKDIVESWNSTWKGDYHIVTDRVVDTDGVTQVLGVTKTGTTSKGIALALSRTRTLLGTSGAYKVDTDESKTFKDGRTQTEHWTKTVNADGSETISGYIAHVDGWMTEINGARGTDGKVKVNVSKIAPLPSNWPSPSPVPTASASDDPSPSPSPSASADTGATDSSSPTPSPSAS